MLSYMIIIVIILLLLLNRQFLFKNCQYKDKYLYNSTYNSNHNSTYNSTYKDIDHIESFLGNDTKINEYSIDDDYYIDRSGTKGYLYNIEIPDLNKCVPADINPSYQNTKKIKDYDNIINSLELYYDNISDCLDYNKLKSDIDSDMSETNKVQSMCSDGFAYRSNGLTPLEERLDFNQGILFSTMDQYKRGL